MEAIMICYIDEIRKIHGNIFQVFSKFYETEMMLLDVWLSQQLRMCIVKNNSQSILYRKEGNSFFVKRDLANSLECYTKSLCFAVFNEKEYGLALANRSAVAFEMKEFQQCLADIELCFKANYPDDLKPKIYIRQAECYCELNNKEALDKCISEAVKFLNQTDVVDKDKYLMKLNELGTTTMADSKIETTSDDLYQIPQFPDGENDCLAFASSKIKMHFNQSKGRHIVAKTKINRGEILFIEKAFTFAPIFTKDQVLTSTKCYHCLKDVISCIPCEFCTVCVYCNEKCRNLSWQSCHQWECKGMQANLWYQLGIAFPALKALLKGVPSCFSTLEGGWENDIERFGDKLDNYRYFNRLSAKIYNKNVAQFIVMAASVVSYLEHYTNFFNHILQQPNSPKKDMNSLIKYIGGLMTKHIAQIACNSSVIEQWTSSSSDLLFPDGLIKTACAIFPSVSIMNHSCKPNVTNFFICDTIIVKALQDIGQDEEIFNCYGIDYRFMNYKQRQTTLKKLYHFQCKCIICSDPSRELEMLDSYLCTNCKGNIPEKVYSECSACVSCQQKFNLMPFRKVNREAQKCLEDSSCPLENLIKSLTVRQKFLYKHHRDFKEIYFRLYSYFVEHGDAENTFKYFLFWLENEQAHCGSSSRSIGTKLYEAALAILHCLQSDQAKNGTNLISFLENVEKMFKEAKVILNLYYPEYITNKLNNKIKFISNK